MDGVQDAFLFLEVKSANLIFTKEKLPTPETSKKDKNAELLTHTLLSKPDIIEYAKTADNPNSTNISGSLPFVFRCFWDPQDELGLKRVVGLDAYNELLKGLEDPLSNDLESKSNDNDINTRLRSPSPFNIGGPFIKSPSPTLTDNRAGTTTSLYSNNDYNDEKDRLMWWSERKGESFECKNENEILIKGKKEGNELKYITPNYLPINFFTRTKRFPLSEESLTALCNMKIGIEIHILPNDINLNDITFSNKTFIGCSYISLGNFLSQENNELTLKLPITDRNVSFSDSLYYPDDMNNKISESILFKSNLTNESTISITISRDDILNDYLLEGTIFSIDSLKLKNLPNQWCCNIPFEKEKKDNDDNNINDDDDNDTKDKSKKDKTKKMKQKKEVDPFSHLSPNEAAVAKWEENFQESLKEVKPIERQRIAFSYGSQDAQSVFPQIYSGIGKMSYKINKIEKKDTNPFSDLNPVSIDTDELEAKESPRTRKGLNSAGKSPRLSRGSRTSSFNISEQVIKVPEIEDINVEWLIEWNKEDCGKKLFLNRDSIETLIRSIGNNIPISLNIEREVLTDNDLDEFSILVNNNNIDNNNMNNLQNKNKKNKKDNKKDINNDDNNDNVVLHFPSNPQFDMTSPNWITRADVISNVLIQYIKKTPEDGFTLQAKLNYDMPPEIENETIKNDNELNENDENDIDNKIDENNDNEPKMIGKSPRRASFYMDKVIQATGRENSLEGAGTYMEINFKLSRPLRESLGKGTGEFLSDKLDLGEVLPKREFQPQEKPRDIEAEFRSMVNILVNEIVAQYIDIFQQENNDNDDMNNLTFEERQKQFFYILSSSGVYHSFKEKLKPFIQRMVRVNFRRKPKDPKEEQTYISKLFVTLMAHVTKVLNERFENSFNSLLLDNNNTDNKNNEIILSTPPTNSESLPGESEIDRLYRLSKEAFVVESFQDCTSHLLHLISLIKQELLIAADPSLLSPPISPSRTPSPSLYENRHKKPLAFNNLPSELLIKLELSYFLLSKSFMSCSLIAANKEALENTLKKLETINQSPENNNNNNNNSDDDNDSINNNRDHPRSKTPSHGWVDEKIFSRAPSPIYNAFQNDHNPSLTIDELTNNSQPDEVDLLLPSSPTQLWSLAEQCLKESTSISIQINNHPDTLKDYTTPFPLALYEDIQLTTSSIINPFLENGTLESIAPGLIYGCFMIERGLINKAGLVLFTTLYQLLQKYGYQKENQNNIDQRNNILTINESDIDELTDYYFSNNLELYGKLPPLIHTIMALYFDASDNGLLARKSLAIGSKIFADYQSELLISDDETSKKRSGVIIMMDTAEFLLYHNIPGLAGRCLYLSDQCEKSFEKKCQELGKSSASTPFLRGKYKRLLSWYFQSIGAMEDAIETGRSSIKSSSNDSENWLILANAFYQKKDKNNTIQTYYEALNILKNIENDIKDQELEEKKRLEAKKRDAGISPRKSKSTSSKTSSRGSSRASSPDLDNMNNDIINNDNIFKIPKIQLKIPLELFTRTTHFLIRSNRFDEAKTLALKGCKYYSSWYLWAQAGISLLRLDEFSQAEEALMEANILNPRHALPWAYLTLLNLSMKDENRIELANSTLKQSLRFRLNDVHVICEVADAFLKIDRNDIVELLLRKALSIDSNNLTIRKNLAEILTKQNSYSAAIEQYKYYFDEEKKLQKKLKKKEENRIAQGKEKTLEEEEKEKSEELRREDEKREAMDEYVKLLKYMGREDEI